MRAGWIVRSVVAGAAFVAAGADLGAPGWSLVATAQAAEADVCKDAMGKNRKRCRIDVKVVDDPVKQCVITIPDPYQEAIVLSGQSDIRIIWRLNDGNGDYLFCRQTGDGVFLKSPIRQQDGQVLAMRVMKTRDSDNNDTEDEFNCSPRFRWTFKNDTDDVHAGTQYDYFIRVRSRDYTRTCRYDPFVKNG